MSTSPTHSAEQESSRPVGPAHGCLQRTFIGWTIFFVIGVLVQVFMAGLMVLVPVAAAVGQIVHVSLGSLLVLVTLPLLILSLISGLPTSVKWLSALLVLLVALQSIWIYPMRHWGLPWLSAMHPVSALFIFTIPLYIIARSRRAMQEAVAAQSPMPDYGQ
ncbi:MAG: hypothetical protein J2P36_34845 [Ktedonobacteraceae bacterium]|nr:hypothetical protein [Ktedonobacteraceae bacterium]